MNILAQIIIILFFSTTLFAEIDNTKRWQVKGYIAALDDSNIKVRSSAIDVLKNNGWIGKKHIHIILGLLNDEDKYVRRSAIEILKKMDEPAKVKKYITYIAILLNDEDKYVRRSAIDLLGKMGESAKNYIADIANFLNDDDEFFHRSSLVALGDMAGSGKKYISSEIAKYIKQKRTNAFFLMLAIETLQKLGKPAIPEIAKFLYDENKYVRYLALNALSKMYEDESIPVIEKFLFEDDENLRCLNIENLVIIAKSSKRYIPEIAKYLNDKNKDFRCLAIDALGQMGELAKHYIPEIAKFLNDKNEKIRLSAINALGQMGELAKDYIPEIANFLNDKNDIFRCSAIDALGKMGKPARKYITEITAYMKKDDKNLNRSALNFLGRMGEIAIPEITEFLYSDNIYVRHLAFNVLEKMGEPAIPEMTKLLNHEDVTVRQLAIHALSKMCKAVTLDTLDITKFLSNEDELVRRLGINALKMMGNESKKKYILEIGVLLKNDDKNVCRSAINALKLIGKSAEKYIPDIANFLKDEDEYVRLSAIDALKIMGESSRKYIPDIAKLLKDEDEYVRLSAIDALKVMGESSKKYIPDIANLLKDMNGDVRRSAMNFLEKWGELAIPDILKFLNDEDLYTRISAIESLGKMGESAIPEIIKFFNDGDEYVRRTAIENVSVELSLNEIIFILENCHYVSTLNVYMYRLNSYKLSGGKEDVSLAMKWIGKPSFLPKFIKYENAKKTLIIFKKIWNKTKETPNIHSEINGRIAQIICNMGVKWKKDDISLLSFYSENLIKTSYVGSIVSEINKIKKKKWALIFLSILTTHLTFWIILIFFYPKSEKIQALFFWNPYYRNIIGLCYVSVIILLIPFFRKRLLSPFREPFLADAELKEFNHQLYFDKSKVIYNENMISNISDAIPIVKGQILLEGESGLGKTMYLKYLVRKSKRLSVYLRADRCKKSVINAIKEKIPSIELQNSKFLDSLIYSGSLDIYIDGLNEVNAETRVLITQFVEKFFKTNIILTSQFLEWKAPVNIKKYILQPLDQEVIEEFLISREYKKNEQFINRCKEYLSKTLNKEQPEHILEFVTKLHSNPMDLTVISSMLLENIEPDPLKLQQQQYKIMAKDYMKHNINKPFPLKAFSEHIYQMRLRNEYELYHDEFPAELSCMERSKMVLARTDDNDDQTIKYDSQSVIMKENNIRKYYFRHDKIMEFFIAQTFLGDLNERIKKHLNDSEFRGVYFLLAYLMDIKNAQVLREMIIMNAANTNNNTVSNNFILLLNSRVNIEREKNEKNNF